MAGCQIKSVYGAALRNVIFTENVKGRPGVSNLTQLSVRTALPEVFRPVAVERIKRSPEL
jgi:hypothetical protein